MPSWLAPSPAAGRGEAGAAAQGPKRLTCARFSLLASLGEPPVGQRAERMPVLRARARTQRGV